MPEVYRTYKISEVYRVYRRLQGVYMCLQIVYRGFTLPFTGCKLRAWCPFNAFTLFINNPQDKLRSRGGRGTQIATLDAV